MIAWFVLALCLFLVAIAVARRHFRELTETLIFRRSVAVCLILFVLVATSGLIGSAPAHP